MFPAWFMSSRWLKAALPALLAAVFCLINYYSSFDAARAAAEYLRFPAGSALLAGIPGGDVAWNMPLYPVFLALVMNLRPDPALLFIVSRLVIYALVFSAGFLLRGYRGGVVSLVTACLAEVASGYVYDAEQSFYAVF